MDTGKRGTFATIAARNKNRPSLSTKEELQMARSQITSFIEQRVTDADARGVVVPMSGRLDSTLTTILTVEALGSDRVFGLGLPRNITDGYHMMDACTIANGLGIEFTELNLSPLLDKFKEICPSELDQEQNRQAIRNVVARFRMVYTYYVANTELRLVIGTTNRSERLLGYFTKYGDGAADLYPLGDLYKSEVQTLAQHVGVPRRIIHKTPTAGLWAGQTDEKELGASYADIDHLLHQLAVHSESIEKAVDTLGIDESTAEQIINKYLDSLHKSDNLSHARCW